MKTISSRLTLVLFLLTLNFTIASAQDLDTATIYGRIQDQNVAVIPGATIEATLIKTGVIRTVVSDAEGRYRLIQLEPGFYSLRVSFAGFAAQEMKEFLTVSGQNLELNFVLLPASINVETVIVSATPQIIDTKRTVVGGAVTARETQLLPLANRSVLDVIFTLPGVTEEPLSTRDLAEDRINTSTTPEEAGNFSLAGAPAYSNNTTIDGLDNNDDRAARERFQPSIEAVEEVQVITNQFSAEYGRASGGRVNLRTHSGSTNYRGKLFYYFRDEALNSNTFRNNSLGLPRLPLQEHVGGFTFGGPVRLPKKKLNAVFFTAYESTRVLDTALIDTLVPLKTNPLFALPPPTNPERNRIEDTNEPALATEVAPFISPISTPSKASNFISRIDHQLSQTHNLAFVYQRGRLTNLRGFGGGNRLAESLLGRRRHSDAVSISDNLVFSASAVNQTRFQYSRLAPGIKTLNNGPVVLITLNDPLIPDDPERRTGTLIAGSSTSGSSDRREVRYQLQNILSIVSGNHSLKFGFDYHRVLSEFIDLSDATGTYNFASAGDFLANVPSRFRQTFQTTSSQRNTYLGFFAQDEWQVFSRLLLCYGLRYERETIVRDLNNFGPRFSLAYNPLDSGKLVLRFGGGMFYNRALLRTIDDFTLGKQQLFFDTTALLDSQSGRVMSAAQHREFIAANFHFPETLSPNSPLVKTLGVLNSEFSRRLDPELRIPESYQFNFGIERDLGRGYSVEANFTWTRGIHLWREFNANAPRLPAGYSNFTSFLASRDFANFRDPRNNNRPIYNASNAGELIRFVFQSTAPNPNAINRVVEFGVPVSIFNLNSSSSTTALEAALASLNDRRPDPTKAEVEQLISAGNSFYRGLTVELRRRFGFDSEGLSFSFRAGYTFSRLIDDGVVNTSDALTPGDFRAERARSLLDRRHRFVVSGVFTLPKFLGLIQLGPILRIASGAPFNISIGGTDRNLDDVSNDRPNFSGDTRSLRWREPGSEIDPELVAAFSLPSIGQSGNLPRNAGRGPGLFLFDLNVTREFRLSERVSFRPVLEFDNVLNKTVFSFGSEFINFNALSPTATEDQRQAFLELFLLATRTLRHRQIRLALKLEF
jgi:Carboxypeptidase regulatory-like domain/TonB dependent receptor-like, beta-barrel/TonB-dependent Receptor Plug Domain